MENFFDRVSYLIETGVDVSLEARGRVFGYRILDYARYNLATFEAELKYAPEDTEIYCDFNELIYASNPSEYTLKATYNSELLPIVKPH